MNWTELTQAGFKITVTHPCSCKWLSGAAGYSGSLLKSLLKLSVATLRFWKIFINTFLFLTMSSTTCVLWFLILRLSTASIRIPSLISSFIIIPMVISSLLLLISPLFQPSSLLHQNPVLFRTVLIFIRFWLLLQVCFIVHFPFLILMTDSGFDLNFTKSLKGSDTGTW